MKRWLQAMMGGVVAVGLFGACGLKESTHVSYKAPGDSGTENTNTNDPCQQTALTAYRDNVASAVDGTCSMVSCHSSAVPTLKLTKSKDVENRAALKKYTGTTSAKIVSKIAPGGTHTGGDQSKILTKDKIDTWLAAEAECK